MTLILKHKWFDMIAGGVKREEYRDWNPRYMRMLDNLLALPASERIIEFRRGYTKTSVKVYFDGGWCHEHEGDMKLAARHGFEFRPEWGYEKGKRLIVFKLGEIVK